MKYEKERCELIECARAMEHYGLVMLSGGNVSLRMKDGTFLVTPSAMAYDSMIPEDIVLVNGKGETIEGKRRPTSDLEAILYIFEKMPDVNVVLHTHQPKAVAVSLVTEEVPVISTTMVDELHDSVKVAPFTISSDKGMGVSTVEYAQKKGKAVILKKLTYSKKKIYLQFKYGKKYGYLHVNRANYNFEKPLFQNVNSRLAG